MLQEPNLTKLRTMINTGSEVYGQAEVPDSTRIFVDNSVRVSWWCLLGIRPSGLYIMAKDKVLSDQIEQHTSHIASIKAQIKLVGEGIRELMNILNQL
jgi:hypothetical protein